jgi:hypothetical protein
MVVRFEVDEVVCETCQLFLEKTVISAVSEAGGALEVDVNGAKYTVDGKSGWPGNVGEVQRPGFHARGRDAEVLTAP